MNKNLLVASLESYVSKDDVGLGRVDFLSRVRDRISEDLAGRAKSFSLIESLEAAGFEVISNEATEEAGFVILRGKKDA